MRRGIANYAHFLGRWIWLAFIPSVRWSRTVAGVITLFTPLALAHVEAIQTAFPVVQTYLVAVPRRLSWLPLMLFLLFFGARLLIAPYWLYRDKPAAKTTATYDQAKALSELFRTGQLLFEKRVGPNSDFIVWQHEVGEWSSDVILLLAAIDKGEAFAFESIGFEHRQNQNRNYDAQYAAVRGQLAARLQKLRLITGRHLEGQGRRRA